MRRAWNTKRNFLCVKSKINTTISMTFSMRRVFFSNIAHSRTVKELVILLVFTLKWLLKLKQREFGLGLQGVTRNYKWPVHLGYEYNKKCTNAMKLIIYLNIRTYTI